MMLLVTHGNTLEKYSLVQPGPSGWNLAQAKPGLIWTGEEKGSKVLSKKHTLLRAPRIRVPETPGRDEDRDCTDYSSAFSDALAELFCAGNKGNVCFILSVEDFSSHLVLIFTAELSCHCKCTHLLPVLNKRPSGVMKTFCLIFEQTMATSSLLFQNFPLVESASLLCYPDGKGQEKI